MLSILSQLNGELAEWSKALPWKGSIPQKGIVGSNPMFSAIFFILLTSILIFTHWNILKSDPLLNYDDSYVVAPLEKINTIGDYVSSFKANKVYDVQPVRDLSLWLDYKIQNQTGLHVHHATNLIVWIAILFLFFKLMLFFEIPLIVNYALVSLYAFHPALTNALVWVTARKHLLSTFFILWASYIVVKKANEVLCTYDVLSIVVLYLLSCFSQPINILWPLWILAFGFVAGWSISEILKDKKKLTLMTMLTIVFVVVAIINQHYYASTFVEQSQNLKYVETESNQLSFRLLLLGRSFWQAVVPYWSTPLYYYPGSVLNLFGIVLFSLGTWIVLRSKKSLYLSWGLFSLLPVMVVTINLTMVFGSDTYILNTVIGVYLCFALVLKKHSRWFEKKTTKALFLLIFSSILVSFAFQANSVSSAWESDLAQTTRAVNVEPSPVAINFHIQNLLNSKNYTDALIYSEQLLGWDPNFKTLAQLYSSSIFHHPKINIETKRRLLSELLKTHPQSPWVKYFLASLYAFENNFSDAADLMQTISLKDFWEFKSECSIIAAEFNFFLRKSGREMAKFEEKLEQIKSACKTHWNQSLYETRKRDLLAP